MMNERDSELALKDAEIARLKEMNQDYLNTIEKLQKEIELLQANLNVSMGKPDYGFIGSPTSLDIIMDDAIKEDHERESVDKHFI